MNYCSPCASRGKPNVEAVKLIENEWFCEKCWTGGEDRERMTEVGRIGHRGYKMALAFLKGNLQQTEIPTNDVQVLRCRLERMAKHRKISIMSRAKGANLVAVWKVKTV
jgi:hypothetical protein